MDTIAPLPGADTVLRRIAKNEQIPNALVFTGQNNSGRKQAAIGFVQTINCQKDDRISADGKPCHLCPSCRKTESGAHPDILSVVPENGIIRTAQIKNIFSSASTRPHEGKMRMVVIEDADKMNREASNSLLKILEEPPLRTFFVLTAKNLTDLLPTIVSRCRHVRFKPLPAKTIQQALVTDHGVDPVLAAAAAEYGDGRLNRAMMFAGLPDREDPADWVQG
ncbi:MAG: DNA polymerase III subunit delta', partial [Desulfobacteraceae bacterium]